MINDYQHFVLSTTSNESKDLDAFMRKVHAIDTDTMFNIPLLLTAIVGMSSEMGEFSEIVKKIIFQGKPLTADEHYHMKRELGDICWYLANACTALGYSFDDVLKENINKLEKRYPNGFEVARSENRAAGDI